MQVEKMTPGQRQTFSDKFNQWLKDVKLIPPYSPGTAEDSPGFVAREGRLQACGFTPAQARKELTWKIYQHRKERR